MDLNQQCDDPALDSSTLSHTSGRKRDASVANPTSTALTLPKFKKECQPKVRRPSAILPTRYRLEAPKSGDTEPPRETAFASNEPYPIFTSDGNIELLRPLDHANNAKSYRYQPCVADPAFPHKQYFRATETNPAIPRLSFEDSDKGLRFDRGGTIATTLKGWRSCRANVWAREGRWFFEVKLLGMQQAIAESTQDGHRRPAPHVRVGFSRREASLDCPVGFDGFSYGISDSRLEAWHRSRPTKHTSLDSDCTIAVPLPSSLSMGDVIGLEICLPPLKLHRQIVRDGSESSFVYDVVRDRIPIPYRGLTYFESFEYQATKLMENYNDRTHPRPGTISPTSNNPINDSLHPYPTHPFPSIRILPSSYIRVWVNGLLMGTPFTDLLPFLPPASNVPIHLTQGVSARPDLDDGTLGYYPTISVFSGGTASIHFGPDFMYPPSSLTQSGKWLRAPPPPPPQPTILAFSPHKKIGEGLPPLPLRPFHERFEEQIAEDIVWDLIDEVTFFIVDEGFACD